MLLEVVHQLFLAVHTELLVVDATRDRGPLEVEQSQLWLLRLAPVVPSLQHSADDARVVAAFYDHVSELTVLAKTATVLLTDLVILSQNVPLAVERSLLLSVWLLQLIPVPFLLALQPAERCHALLVILAATCHTLLDVVCLSLTALDHFLAELLNSLLFELDDILAFVLFLLKFARQAVLLATLLPPRGALMVLLVAANRTPILAMPIVLVHLAKLPEEFLPLNWVRLITVQFVHLKQVQLVFVNLSVVNLFAQRVPDWKVPSYQPRILERELQIQQRFLALLRRFDSLFKILRKGLNFLATIGRYW